MQEKPDMFHFSLLNGLWDRVDFGYGSIEPIAPKEKVHEYLREHLHYEDFFYPQRYIEWHASFFSDDWKKKSNSSRIPLIWRHTDDDQIFCSHKINYQLTYPVSSESHDLMAFIILNYIAFIHDTRLMFKYQWHESRVKIPFFCKPRLPFKWSIEDVPDMLDQMIEYLSSVDIRKLKKISNILYLRNKTTSYEFTWERFAWRYTVLDDIWSANKDKIREKKIPHRQRLKCMCDFFNIHFSDADADDIVKKRNAIIHEINYEYESNQSIDDEKLETDGIMSSGGQVAYNLDLKLTNLIDRLIMHTIGIDCKYRTTQWNYNFRLEPYGRK